MKSANEEKSKLEGQIAELEVQIKRLFQSEKELFESKTSLNMHVKRINILNRFSLSSMAVDNEADILSSFLSLFKALFSIVAGAVFREEVSKLLLTHRYFGFSTEIEECTSIGTVIDKEEFVAGTVILNLPKERLKTNSFASALIEMLESEGEDSEACETLCIMPIKDLNTNRFFFAVLLCESENFNSRGKTNRCLHKDDVEFVELSRSHCESALHNLNMNKKLSNLLEEYKNLNENLELKVKDRTKQLEDQSVVLFEKNQNISSMLDNIQMGILVVNTRVGRF